MEIEKFIHEQLFMLFGSNFKSSIVSKPVMNSDQTLQQPGKVGGVVGISPFVMSDVDGLSTINSVDEESQSVTNSVSDFSSTIRGSPTSSFHGISTRSFNEETECQYERNQSSPQSDEAEDDEALNTVTTSSQSIENSSTYDNVQVNGLKSNISSERQKIDDVVADEVHTELLCSSYIDVIPSSSNYEVSEILDKDKEKETSTKKIEDHNLPDNLRNAEVNQTLSMKVPQFSEEVCHTDKIQTGSQSEVSKSENVNKESNMVSIKGKRRPEHLTVEMVSMQSVPDGLGICEANQAILIEDEVTDERFVAVTLDRCELDESQTGESSNKESTNDQYSDYHLLMTKKSYKCVPDDSGNATSVQAKSIDERLITIKASNECTSDDSDTDQANEMLSIKGDDIDEHFFIHSDQYMPDDSETVESCSKITINDRSCDECLFVTNISDQNVPEELDTGESSNIVSTAEDGSGNSFAIKMPDHFLADKSVASTSFEGEGGDESLPVTKKTHQFLSDDSDINKLIDTESMNGDNSLDLNIVAERQPTDEIDAHNFGSETKSFISDNVNAASETSVHNNFSIVENIPGQCLSNNLSTTEGDKPVNAVLEDNKDDIGDEGFTSTANHEENLVSSFSKENIENRTEPKLNVDRFGKEISSNIQLKSEFLKLEDDKLPGIHTDSTRCVHSLQGGATITDFNTTKIHSIEALPTQHVLSGLAVDRGESDETFTKQAPQVSTGESEETRDQRQSSWKSGDAKHTPKTEMLEPLMRMEVSPKLGDVPKVTCSVKNEYDLFNNDTLKDDVDTNNVHQDEENEFKQKEHDTIRVGTRSDKDDVVDEIEKSSDEADGSLDDGSLEGQGERKPTKSEARHTRKDEAFESLMQMKASYTAMGEFGDVPKVRCSVKIESDLLIDDASTEAGSDNIIDPDRESEYSRKKHDTIHTSTSLDLYGVIDKTEKAVNEPDGSLEGQDERKRNSLKPEEAKYTSKEEIFESLTQMEDSHTAMVGLKNATKVTSSVKIESDRLVNDTLKEECSENIMDPDRESQPNQEERDTKYVSTNPDQYGEIDEVKKSADETEGSLEDQSDRSQNSLESEESGPIPRGEIYGPSMQIVDSRTAFDEFRDIPKVSSSIKNKSDIVIGHTSKGGNDNTIDLYRESQEEHDTGDVSTNPDQDDVVDITEKSVDGSLEDEDDNSVVTFGSVEKKNVTDNESVNKRDIDRTPKRRNKGDTYVPTDRNVDVDEENSVLDEDLGGSIRSLNSSGSYTDDDNDDAEIQDNANVVFWWNDDHAVTSLDNSFNASKSVEEKSMNTDQSSLSAGISTPAVFSSVSRLSSLRLMRKKYSDDRRVSFRHQSKGRRIMLSVESLQPSAKPASVVMDNEIVEWRVPPAHVKELIDSLHAVSMSRRSHACGALKVMSTKKANLFSLARTESLLDSIIFAIESTFNAVTEMDLLMDIRSRAMAVLSNIASLPRNRTLLYNRPGLTSCLTTILREDYQESRVLACVILAYLSKNDEFKENLTQIDGLVDMLTHLFSGKHYGPFFDIKDESGSLSGSSCSAKSVLNYVKEDSKAGMWEGVDEGSQLCQTSVRDNDDKSVDSGISKLTMTSGVRSETQCEYITPLQLKLYENKSKPYLSQTRTNVCAIFLQLSRFSITSVSQFSICIFFITTC